MPGDAKVWLGLRAVEALLEPEFGSPKPQVQTVEPPDEPSVNWTGAPATGEAGANVKLADGSVPRGPVV